MLSRVTNAETGSTSWRQARLEPSTNFTWSSPPSMATPRQLLFCSRKRVFDSR